MSGMPGNPHEDAIQTHAIYGISPEATATLALAYEVRTVALLLASSMAGTADSADDQYETAMRRMGGGR